MKAARGVAAVRSVSTAASSPSKSSALPLLEQLQSRCCRLSSKVSSSSSRSGDVSAGTVQKRREMKGREERCETTEGVWVFHRHGDRTPSRPLVADDMLASESAFWYSKIPSSDRALYDALSTRFPPSIHESNNHGKYFDVDGGKEPYGFLTFKGMDQMRTVGQTFRRRYRSEDRTVVDSFLDHWNVTCFSTNYLRTVMSAQCFLDGLLVTFDNNNNDDLSYEDMTPEQYLTRSMHNDNHHPPIAVQVRDRENDTLNAFDKHPEFMQRLVQNVVTAPPFESYDAKVAPLAAQLVHYLPGLTQSTNYYGGPSGINWIHATDHFVCRSSHDVPYSRFSIFENEAHVERTLEAMSHETLTHLAWRFRQWYQSPRLLAAIAVPPLREIETQMLDTLLLLKHEKKEKKKPFVVYSCHDVTILSLLYGIGADFLQKESSEEYHGTECCRYWPAYASTLVFELVRINRSSSDATNSGETKDSHVVKITLNGTPVRIRSLFEKGDQGDNGCANVKVGQNVDSPIVTQGNAVVETCLSVTDFSTIVNNLEVAGNHDDGSETLDEEKADKEQRRSVVRDMSGWTG